MIREVRDPAPLRALIVDVPIRPEKVLRIERSELGLGTILRRGDGEAFYVSNDEIPELIEALQRRGELA